MYHAHPVSAADGKYRASFSGSIAEAAHCHHDRAGGHRVLADTRPHDGAVLGKQAADPPPESDLDSGAAAVPGEHVDHRLAAPDRAVHTRYALVTAEHQLVVELHPEVTEPFHRRPGQFRSRRTTADSTFHWLSCMYS